MKADNFDTPTNPYHYVLHCIGGKWKMTILHEIYTYGSIRFNQTLKILPISEKVFSQQLKELVEAGLIRRISYDTVPPKVEYVLTPSGEQLIPALDILYIWSIRQMHDRRIPIDADAFVVHKSATYVDALGDIMRENNGELNAYKEGVRYARCRTGSYPGQRHAQAGPVCPATGGVQPAAGYL